MKSIKSKLIELLPQSVVMRLRALDHYINGEPELRLLKVLVDPRRKAIDAGANIGTYSYFLRKYATAVYAYEPNPELAATLRAAMPKVTVRQVALSDRPAELVFSVPVDSEGRPCHELGSVAQEFSGQVRQFPVQCITIDSEVLSDVGFIKIDVEQHEREVLRGGLETINRCRPVILIEVYPLKYQRPLQQEFNFILQNDYCAWFLFSGKWAPLETFDASTHAAPEKFGKKGQFMGNNMIFFPKEHPRAKIGPT
jgi:FkbM family methyltransferase